MVFLVVVIVFFDVSRLVVFVLFVYRIDGEDRSFVIEILKCWLHGLYCFINILNWFYVLKGK